MAIQLPRRRDVRPSRKYAQPITRQMIKPVPGRRDPGAQGGPSAAATPLAFGGGEGLMQAGTQLQELGAEWRRAELQQQQQRNALLLERLTLYIKDGLNEIIAKPLVVMSQQNKGSFPNFGGNQTQSPPSLGGGGHQGLLTEDYGRHYSTAKSTAFPAKEI